MNNQSMLSAPSLDRLQIAWLQEIGLDRHMLARWTLPLQEPAQVSPSVAATPIAPKPAIVSVTDHPPVARLSATETAAALGGFQRAAPVIPAATNVPAQPDVDAELPQDWAALRTHAQACQACDLHQGRSTVVFGEGDLLEPDWMIIGEAPGSSDDRHGLPFQGKPGQLLAAMLASIGVGLPPALENATAADESSGADDRTRVFCTNVIQCRPLGNRTPSPQEIAACMPYLLRQIQVLQPKRILALGHLAAQALLGIDAPLDQLRGRIHPWKAPSGQTIPLVATWHPATLLLRPQHKADVWQDLNLARSIGPD